jgi:urease accessory protein
MGYVMITLHRCSRNVGGVAPLVLVLTVATVLSAQAHHVMGGRTPETFMQGFLSGLAHPVIGLDHLAFIVGMGLAAGVATLNLAIPVVFIVASALGVGLHVQGVALPAAELVVAASVLLIGAMVAAGRALPTGGWVALFALAGLFHGYAFGESIFGAERAPLEAYLAGLVIVQTVLAVGIALTARRGAADMIKPRLAGAAIAGIGIAILAGLILPA